MVYGHVGTRDTYQSVRLSASTYWVPMQTSRRMFKFRCNYVFICTVRYFILSLNIDVCMGTTQYVLALNRTDWRVCGMWYVVAVPGGGRVRGGLRDNHRPSALAPGTIQWAGVAPSCSYYSAYSSSLLVQYYYYYYYYYYHSSSYLLGGVGG